MPATIMDFMRVGSDGVKKREAGCATVDAATDWERLDAGIRETVRVLCENGIETDESCEDRRPLLPGTHRLY